MGGSPSGVARQTESQSCVKPNNNNIAPFGAKGLRGNYKGAWLIRNSTGDDYDDITSYEILKMCTIIHIYVYLNHLYERYTKIGTKKAMFQKNVYRIMKSWQIHIASRLDKD